MESCSEDMDTCEETASNPSVKSAPDAPEKCPGVSERDEEVNGEAGQGVPATVGNPAEAAPASEAAPAKRRRAASPRRGGGGAAEGAPRRGKWSVEEEAFCASLISAFDNGLLPIENGATLRAFLSKKLNCSAMRISKKFAGEKCLGKQIYLRAPAAPADPDALAAEAAALAVRNVRLRRAKRERLRKFD